MSETITLITLCALILLVVSWWMLFIVPEREQAIVERLGTFKKVCKPGLHVCIPFLDRIAFRCEMREQAISIPARPCTTRDNIVIEVDAVIRLKVVDARSASYAVADYCMAIIGSARSLLEKEAASLTLHEIFSEQERVNEQLTHELAKVAESWGVQVVHHEIQNIRPSQKFIDALRTNFETRRKTQADAFSKESERKAEALRAESEQRSAMAMSEAEEQCRIEETRCQATQRETLLEASAEGIRILAETCRQPAGEEALELLLVEQSLDELDRMVDPLQANRVPGFASTVRTRTGDRGNDLASLVNLPMSDISPAEGPARGQ